jgi:hypothetical protein
MFMGDKKYLQSYIYNSIGQNSTEIDESSDTPPIITIEEIYEEKGFIYLKANVKDVDNQVFRVVYAEKDKIGIAWKDSKKIYNIYFNPELSPKEK